MKKLIIVLIGFFIPAVVFAEGIPSSPMMNSAAIISKFNSGTCSGYLKSDGTCDTPAGTGDMTKAVYDSNDDGVFVDAQVATTLTLETILGTPVITNGVAIGTDDTGHLIDEASNGATSNTLYIGNESILTSGDIGVSVQGYNANTTILGATIGAAEVDADIATQAELDAVAALVDTDDEIIAIINASPSTYIDTAAGGTGVGTFTDGGLLIGNAAGDIQVTAAGLTTQILVGGGAGTDPSWGTDLPTAVTIGSAYIYRVGGTDVADADVADDITCSNYLPLAGGTMSDTLITDASDATASGLRLPHGAAPSAPTNGDIWTTTAGIYVRINGGTVGPLGTSTGDVESVGDCASGACLDGSSDGGTYVRLYDGDSNYSALAAGNTSADLTFTLPTAYPGAANGIMVMSTAGAISTLAATTYLTDIVLDTTPQLGGDLDTNSHNITGIAALTVSTSLGTAAAEVPNIYIADSGNIYFQNDQSVYLTSSASTLTLTGQMVATAGMDLGTSQALVGTTAMTIGNNGQTVAINSSDWDISATGDMTGIGAIGIDGAVTFSGSGSIAVPTTTSGDQTRTVGQLGLKTDEDLIVTHGGANGEVQDEVGLSLLQHISFPFDPSAWYDQESTYRSVPIMRVGDDFPHGITITEWRVTYVGGDPTTELDADLICDTTPDFNTAAGATVMDVIDTTAGVASADTGFDSATCANGSELYIHFGADPTDANVVIQFDLWGYAEED